MEQKQRGKFFDAKRKSRILPSVLTGLALALIVFIAAPIDIFANNLEEFAFSFSDFGILSVLFAVLLTAIVTAVLLCMPEKGYRVTKGVLLAIALLLFLQQNFLNFGLNSLPGDNLGTEGPSVFLVVLDGAIWIAVIFAAVFFSLKKDGKGIVSTVCLVLALMISVSQIVSPLTVVLSHDNVFVNYLDRTEGGMTIATDKNYTSVASSRNIYYFCIDRFDEKFAEQAYAEDPGLFADLAGFTWYRDHVSLYGHTYPAVASMLTNKPYDPQKGRAEYLDSAYEGDTPLKRLHDEGYTVNIYSQSYYAYTDAGKLPGYVDNVLAAKGSARGLGSPALSFTMTGFSLYRGAPLFMKSWFNGVNSSSVNNIVKYYGESGGKRYGAYNTDNKAAYFAAKKAGFSGGDYEKAFTFLHVEGCHNTDYDRKWHHTAGKGSIVDSVANSFEIVDLYLNDLRARGLYESATIVITGDHSHPVSDGREVREPRRTALFVKPAGKGEKDEFLLSDAQTSHSDLWATIFRSENLPYEADYGTPVTEIGEGENRKRMYYWHTYSYPFSEYVYEIGGSASDMKNWKQVSCRRFDKRVTD